MKLTRSKAQIVVIMLIIAMIIGIVIPGLIFLTQHEAKWTVKEIKSTRAFHLAEAGLDRGVYKLNETGVWDTAYAGTAISGYNGQTKYSDIEGGYYKIKFSTGSGDYEVTITASGKDSATDECRTIQAIYYSPPGVTSALIAPTISVTGNCEIHWGPMSSTNNMDLQGSADKLFPRKYARGSITCGTPFDHNYPYHKDDGNATTTSGPIAVDDEYREWHAPYDVSDIPDIETSQYKTDAQTGGVYFVGAYNTNNMVNTTYTTYYIIGSATLKNAQLVGNFIVEGTLSIGTSNKGANVTATIPANAWMEYQAGTPDMGPGDDEGADTFAANEYPGDAGNQNSGGGTGTYNIGKTLFQGFIYTTGSATCTGSPVINGCIIIEGTVAGAGTPVIYYNDTIARNVKVSSNPKPTRQSWKELPPQWDPLP